MSRNEHKEDSSQISASFAYRETDSTRLAVHSDAISSFQVIFDRKVWNFKFMLIVCK